VIYKEDFINFYLKQSRGKLLCNWFSIANGSCWNSGKDRNTERWEAVTPFCKEGRIFIQCFSS